MNSKLSLMEKFGQMIILGLDTYEINDEIVEIIEKYKIGGVILYKKNYTSLDTMLEFINKLKNINSKNKIPLFIAIDQENGVVNRLPKDIVNLTSPAKLGKMQNELVVKAANEITTYILKEAGINMNLAPVLDINYYTKSKFASRCYGSSKEDVIKYGLPLMKMLQKNQIISVVKHFPGHGLTNKDSHFMVPKVANVKMAQENIEVFREAISSGADVIMVDHVKVKGYGMKPICLNKKFIQKNLIEDLNYKGLIMTDDLRMGTMPYLHKVKKSIPMAINAGCNIVMIKYKKKNLKLFRKLEDLVKYCEIDPELIDKSAKKIINIKKKYELSNEKINSNIKIDLVNNKIKKINTLVEKSINI